MAEYARLTKAMLIDHVKDLEKQRDEWRKDYYKQVGWRYEDRVNLNNVEKELADLKARDRSPRRLSAARTLCRTQETCKFDALNQVLAWERDAVIEEQKQTILKLREEVEKLQTDKAHLIQIGNQMTEDLRLFAQRMR
jgi:alkylated DNA repair dioxygenase AlkB